MTPRETIEKAAETLEMFGAHFRAAHRRPECDTAESSAAELRAILEPVGDTGWFAIIFADATRKPEIFTSRDSAVKTFDARNESWSCRLFEEVRDRSALQGAPECLICGQPARAVCQEHPRVHLCGLLCACPLHPSVVSRYATTVDSMISAPTDAYRQTVTEVLERMIFPARDPLKIHCLECGPWAAESHKWYCRVGKLAELQRG
jgi:hypothetical protein